MGRSKNTWDHLVDSRGNYINVNENKGAKGESGVKGAKGTPGIKGAKGVASLFFRFRGKIGTFSETGTGAVRPLAGGDVWLVEDENKLYVYTAAQGWVAVREGIGDVVKGQKGEKGYSQKGDKGAPGLKGEKGQKGESVKGDQGQPGQKGKTGNTGPQGLRGPTGQKGEAFEYDDFTPAQLQGLKVKGDKGYGDKGLKGDPFEYADFTSDQLKGLQVKGNKGEIGVGIPGPKGDPFEYGDFTAAQLEALKVKGDKGYGDKGLEGSKGQKGNNVVFDDLTPAQKLEITGPKGSKGSAGTDGVDGNKGESGEKGANGLGVQLKGSVATLNDLPETDLTVGDLYITEDDYHGYVWDGQGWVDIGEFQGPPGQKGDVGPSGPKGDVGPSNVPVGCIMAYAGATAPTGWLLCDGAIIPGEYVQLRALMGNVVPDMRGRYLGGAGGMGLTLGTSYNDSTRKPRNGSFSLSVDTRHRHSFGISKTGISTGSNGGHSHTYDAWGTTKKGGGTGSTNPSVRSTGITTGGTGKHSHTFDLSISNILTDYQGSTTKPVSSGNWDSYTRPHTYAVNYIIKHD